jgi:hypothetical protein
MRRRPRRGAGLDHMLLGDAAESYAELVDVGALE